MQSTNKKALFCISKKFESFSENTKYLEKNTNRIGTSLLEILNNFNDIKQILDKSTTFDKFAQLYSVANYIQDNLSPLSSSLATVLYNDIINRNSDIWDKIEETKRYLNYCENDLSKFEKIIENESLYDDFFNDLIDDQENEISVLVDELSIEHEKEILDKYYNYLTYPDEGIAFIKEKIIELEKDIKKYKKKIAEYFNDYRALNKYISSLKDTITQYLYYFDLLFDIIKREDLPKKDLVYFENTFELNFMLPSCHIYSGYMKNNKLILLKDSDKTQNSLDLINSLKKEKNLIYAQAYEITTLKEYLNVYLNYLIQEKVKLKKCKNCGKYFIPANKSDSKYCDNISPQDSNKTCKEIGSKLFYKKNIANNPVTKEYSRARNTLSKRVSRCDKTDEKELKKLINKFNKLEIDYEKKYKKYLNNQISEEEMINWIISQKEK